MKKMSVIILVFLLLFAGCAAKGVESCPAEEPMVEVPAEEAPAAETTEGAPLAPETMPEEPEDAPQIEPEAPGTAPKEPGSLHMECGSRTIKAMSGGYSWWVDNGDGTATGIEADSMHPLDAKEYMPVLNMDGTTATLLFGPYEPDEVTVQGWSVAHWGNWEAEAEPIPVEGGTIQLKNEGFIYEVTAVWDSLAGCGGTARYAFCAVPLGVELHAEAVTDKGMTLVCTQSGGNPTGELQTGTAYWLEVRKDGDWERVPFADGSTDVAWEDMALLIPMEDTVRWEIDWEKIHGSLDGGTYRIGKEIIDWRGTGDFDTYRLYSDNFSIAWLVDG